MFTSHVLHVALTIAAGVVPPMVLLAAVYRFDLRPEPVLSVVRTFVLGCFSVLVLIPLVGVIKLELGPAALVTGSAVGAAFFALFCAAIPEEILKLCVISWAWRWEPFDEPFDGVVYGAAGALGFAAIENVAYIGTHGPATALARTLTAVPAHAMNGIIIGYFAGRAKFGPARSRVPSVLAGFGLAVLLHAAYDFFFLLGRWAALAGIGSLVVAVVVGGMAVHRLARHQVRDVEAAESHRRRVLGALSSLSVDVSEIPPEARRPLSLMAWLLATWLVVVLGLNGLKVLFVLEPPGTGPALTASFVLAGLAGVVAFTALLWRRPEDGPVRAEERPFH